MRGRMYWQSYCSQCRHVKVYLIPCTLPATRRMYAAAYPNDKTASQRAWRFMVDRLLKRKHYYLSRLAKERYHAS